MERHSYEVEPTPNHIYTKLQIMEKYGIKLSKKASFVPYIKGSSITVVVLKKKWVKKISYSIVIFHRVVFKNLQN